MKKNRILAGLLCAAMLCGLLSGCFGGESNSAASSDTPASASTSTPDSTVPETTSRADTTELKPGNFDENTILTITGTNEAFSPCLGWGPGVSGCSLKAVIAADSLMKWAEDNRLSSRSGDAVQAAFEGWYDALGQLDQENFAESWPMIRQAALDLLNDKDSMTDRIEDAGLEADKMPGCSQQNWQALQSILDECVPEAAGEE